MFTENSQCCLHNDDLESPLKELRLSFLFLLESSSFFFFLFFSFWRDSGFFSHFFSPSLLAGAKGSPVWVLTLGSGEEGRKFQQLWVRSECGRAALAGLVYPAKVSISHLFSGNNLSVGDQFTEYLIAVQTVWQ